MPRYQAHISHPMWQATISGHYQNDRRQREGKVGAVSRSHLPIVCYQSVGSSTGGAASIHETIAATATGVEAMYQVPLGVSNLTT